MASKVKKKRRMVKCTNSTCGGRFDVVYEDCVPVFVCDACGQKDFTWKKFYKVYLQLFNNRENWDNKKHHVSCIIGFFCHMYKTFYNTDYVFWPSNRNPFSSKECLDANKLLVAFNGNAHEVRKYIYWLFKKGLNKNVTITHFGYINTPGLIRKYKLYARKKNILRRESRLPKSFIQWCAENAPSIFDKYNMETMNDLGAMLSFYKAYSEAKSLDTEFDVILEAKRLGLITQEGNLNIGGK